MQHEERERALLQLLKILKRVEDRKPKPPAGDQYVESRTSGIRYDMKYGGANANTGEVMILVSVGSESPPGVQVQHRMKDRARAEKAIQTHGPLPQIVTGLHEEAAADLMAAVGVRLKSCTSDVVRLCLDVPGKQRSKKYYFETIKNFFKHCQQPVGMFTPNELLGTVIYVHVLLFSSCPDLPGPQ